MPAILIDKRACAAVCVLFLAATGCAARAANDAAASPGAQAADASAPASSTGDATPASADAVSGDSAAATPDIKGDSAAAAPEPAQGASAAPASPPNVETQTPAPDDTKLGDATYEVPVASSLESFAKYSVSHVKWEVKKGVRVLEYNLPDDLAGASNKVSLSGPDSGNAWDLSGEAGTASCSAQADQIRCQESLPGITVDVAAIELRVSLGQLAQEKLAVTKVFQGDPLGVLQFTPR